MLRELIHLARHAPSALALKRRLDHVELYDAIMQRGDDAGFRVKREELVSDLRGDVLEIGCGTGMMFEHYGRGAHVRAIDSDADFLERARSRAAGRDIEVLQADAQRLPFADESFDAVVACLVFCSIPDARGALAEARRVLRKGGELRLIEHVVSERPVSRALMHAADPIWLWLNDQGCHMDRDTVKTARSVFDHLDVEGPYKIFSTGLPAFPMVTLRAKK